MAFLGLPLSFRTFKTWVVSSGDAHWKSYRPSFVPFLWLHCLSVTTFMKNGMKEKVTFDTSFVSESLSREQDLCWNALSLDSSINRLFSSINSRCDDGALDSSIVELKRKLREAKRSIAGGTIALFLPVKARGDFLKMFLGPINMHPTRKDVQLKVKEEYYRYKDTTSLLFLLSPSSLLIFRFWVWDGCFQHFQFKCTRRIF